MLFCLKTLTINETTSEYLCLSRKALFNGIILMVYMTETYLGSINKYSKATSTKIDNKWIKWLTSMRERLYGSDLP